MRAALYAVFVFLASACGAADAARITVDIGHTIEEPGAISARGRPEFEFNRELARDIDAALRHRQHVTRLLGADSQSEVQPARRVKGESPDLLLSVHHDAVPEWLLKRWEVEGRMRHYSDRFAGFALFVSRDNPHAERSLRCASAIGAELRKAGFAPSLYHADPTYGEKRPFADETNGVHYYDDLAILRRAQVPALLIEAGVIANRDEELKLREPAIRGKLTEAVAAGVDGCLR